MHRPCWHLSIWKPSNVVHRMHCMHRKLLMCLTALLRQVAELAQRLAQNSAAGLQKLAGHTLWFERDKRAHESAVQVPVIELYTGENMTGRKFVISGAPNEDLTLDGMNDKVSSCKILSGTWMLYVDANFQGQVSALKPGEYPSKESMGLPNDAISSIRPFPPAQANSILLFQDSGFRGRMVHLTSSSDDLAAIDFAGMPLTCTHEHSYKDAGFATFC